MEQDQELFDIARQLRELSARLDAVIAARAEQPSEAAEEAPVVENIEPEAIVAASNPMKLTLNDRYRFLRELFGGDAEAMDVALAEIGTLASAADVEAYVADILELESEEQAVADFIAVATERFKSRPTLLA